MSLECPTEMFPEFWLSQGRQIFLTGSMVSLGAVGDAQRDSPLGSQACFIASCSQAWHKGLISLMVLFWGKGVFLE